MVAMVVPVPSSRRSPGLPSERWTQHLTSTTPDDAHH